MTPSEWLKDGDQVRCFISHGLGSSLPPRRVFGVWLSFSSLTFLLLTLAGTLVSNIVYQKKKVAATNGH